MGITVTMARSSMQMGLGRTMGRCSRAGMSWEQASMSSGRRYSSRRALFGIFLFRISVLLFKA